MTTQQSSLWINDGGFSTAEIEAGRSAALAVLEAAGFTTDEAHTASLAAADGQPFNVAALDAWEEAELAAIAAAAEGWARLPEGACLVLG